MKVPTHQFYELKMEENSGSAPPSSALGAQNHNGGGAGGVQQKLFGEIIVSVSNNKHHQPGGINDVDASGMSTGPSGQGPNNKDQSPQYTMPGVLHFLQHEWARFELERSQWDLDRAEYQVGYTKKRSPDKIPPSPATHHCLLLFPSMSALPIFASANYTIFHLLLSFSTIHL